MSRLPAASVMLVVLTLGVQAHAPAAVPVWIAASRCNGQTIDEAAARVRDYEHRGVAGSSAELLARFGGVAEIIATMSEEREILDSICSSDAERAPFFIHIAATSALALALEGDIAAKLNAACPAAAKAFPTMMLADAWLALANVVNGQNGTVPESFNDLIPKIQSRAQTVGLILPAWADTSAYWRDQIHAAAKKAVATCPSPSPGPSFSPSERKSLRIVRK